MPDEDSRSILVCERKSSSGCPPEFAAIALYFLFSQSPIPNPEASPLEVKAVEVAVRSTEWVDVVGAGRKRSTWPRGVRECLFRVLCARDPKQFRDGIHGCFQAVGDAALCHPRLQVVLQCFVGE